MAMHAESSSYPTNEADYLRLANRFRETHDAKDSPGERAFRWAVGIAALIVLSPVIAMVLVFAVLPALPLALAVGAVLGPANLFGNGEKEEERDVYRSRLVFAEAHGMMH